LSLRKIDTDQSAFFVSGILSGGPTEKRTMELSLRRPVPQSAVSLMDCIRGRRSVRDYAAAAVSREVLLSLVDAAIQAPSAMNEQPWLFTIVTDPKLLDSIAARAKSFMAQSASTGGHSHAGAMLHVEDFHIFYHAPALIVISAPAHGPWSTEDCALAAQNLMLAAYAKALGSCWIGFAQSWLRTPDGKQAVGLPDTHTPVAPIIIGHPKSNPPAVPRNAPAINWLE
jgi:nitroreductase